MTFPARRAVLVGAVLMAAFVLAMPFGSGVGSSPLPALGARPPAPRFKVIAVDGQKLSLDRLLEHGPVLLDFWATWCKPCVAAIPELEALHQDPQWRGLTIIGISVDGPRSFSKVRPFVTRMGITYPIVLDEDGSLQRDYRVRAMPTSVLIDTAGAIVKVTEGFRPGEGEALRASIRALLPSSVPADSAASGAAADSMVAIPPADSSGGRKP
jgi:peroxiredoxin